jgi:hypothetical protein
MGPQDASDRIWLKQSVQFSVAGQVRTIEIALPVRPGASAEEIERLLRQADAGLDQMTQHLNRKVSELLVQEKTQAPAGATPIGRASGTSVSSGARQGLAGAASQGAERSASHPDAAASAAAGPPLDRKQFISEIAILGLNPRQAMERLGVRTLDGVNLQQALEQLRLQLLHERSASTGSPAVSAEDSGGTASGGPQTRGGGGPQPGPLPRQQPPDLRHPSLLAQVAPAEHTLLRPLQESDQLLDDEEPLSAEAIASERGERKSVRERAPAPIPIRGERTLISLQEQVRAQAMLERLRRLRGRLNPPSSDNLKAFRNVVENQIGEEKTAALLQAIWSVSRPEQLSPDQVAECIRWGKDDHFEDEVDMLLRLAAAEES